MKASDAASGGGAIAPMPPVFAPRSPSKMRLWSRAGTRLRTLRPSLSPKTLTSTPLSSSSTTTCRPASPKRSSREALVERALRLVDAVADQHALAEREPVGLDDARAAELGDERAELRRDPPLHRRSIARSGCPPQSITCFANVFDELDARRGRGRTEDGDAARGARVGDAGGGSRVGSDDDQVDRALGRKSRHRGRVVDIDGDVLRDVRGAAVAGRDDDRHVRRIAPARPCQRVLAAPGSDDEDPPYSHSIVDGGLLEMS